MRRAQDCRVDPLQAWPPTPLVGDRATEDLTEETSDDVSWWEVAKDWGGVLVIAAILILLAAVAK